MKRGRRQKARDRNEGEKTNKHWNQKERVVEKQRKNAKKKKKENELFRQAPKGNTRTDEKTLKLWQLLRLITESKGMCKGLTATLTKG